MFFEGLVSGTLSVIILFYLYKRTHYLPFIAIAGIAYFRVLSNIFLQLPSEYFIPLYILSALFLAYLIYIKRHYWPIILLIIEMVFYLYIMIFTTFRLPGMTEFIFSILCLLWFNIYHDEVCVDPWSCR